MCWPNLSHGFPLLKVNPPNINVGQWPEVPWYYLHGDMDSIPERNGMQLRSFIGKLACLTVNNRGAPRMKEMNQKSTFLQDRSSKCGKLGPLVAPCCSIHLSANGPKRYALESSKCAPWQSPNGILMHLMLAYHMLTVFSCVFMRAYPFGLWQLCEDVCSNADWSAVLHVSAYTLVEHFHTCDYLTNPHYIISSLQMVSTTTKRSCQAFGIWCFWKTKKRSETIVIVHCIWTSIAKEKTSVLDLLSSSTSLASERTWNIASQTRRLFHSKNSVYPEACNPVSPGYVEDRLPHTPLTKQNFDIPLHMPVALNDNGPCRMSLVFNLWFTGLPKHAVHLIEIQSSNGAA